MLTAEQKEMAQVCRNLRPDVIPGTNVIPNEAERNAWSSSVIVAMRACKVTAEDTDEFCNIAGVPD